MSFFLDIRFSIFFVQCAVCSVQYAEENKFDFKFIFTFLGLDWKTFRLTQSVNSGQMFFAARKNFFYSFQKKFFELLTDWGRRNIILQAPIR